MVFRTRIDRLSGRVASALCQSKKSQNRQTLGAEFCCSAHAIDDEETERTRGHTANADFSGLASSLKIYNEYLGFISGLGSLQLPPKTRQQRICYLILKSQPRLTPVDVAAYQTCSFIYVNIILNYTTISKTNQHDLNENLLQKLYLPKYVYHLY